MAGFLPEVLDDVADTAAFLRVQRDRVACSRVHGLADLGRIDDRLEAQLDALVIAAEDEPRAWIAASVYGGLFVHAFVALRRGRADTIRDLFRGARGTPEKRRDILAAFGWAPFAEAERASRALEEMPEIEGVFEFSVDVSRVHGRDGISDASERSASGSPRRTADLPAAIGGDDPGLAIAALRWALVLGRRDLAGPALRALASPDPTVAAWAACTAASLGASAAIPRLASVARSAQIRGAPRMALDLALRVLPAPEALALLTDVAAAGRARAAISSAAGWGDPSVLPWLFVQITDMSLARVAGSAILAITGISSRDVAGAVPPGFVSGPSENGLEHDVGLDPDARLSWLDEEKLRARVADLGLAPGVRHHRGEPLGRRVFERMLEDAPQADRWHAAIDLHREVRSDPLFAVGAPAFRQRAALAKRGRSAQTQERAEEARRVAGR